MKAMHNVRLNPDTYSKAKQIAESRGFESVEEFLTLIINEEAATPQVNYDHLFTPEVLAAIDRAEEDVQAGRVYTPDEVREHLRLKGEEWQQKKG